MLSTEQVALSSLEENCLAYHGSPCGGQYNILSCDSRASCDLEGRLSPITSDPGR
jgi:hypothetical protein